MELHFTERTNQHIRENGYSRYYLRAMFKNPVCVRECPPFSDGRVVVTGYGYGMVVKRDTNNGVPVYRAIAVFRDDMCSDAAA